MYKSLLALSLLFLIIGCSERPDPNRRPNQIKLSEGAWRFTMNLNGKLLPFNASLEDSDSDPVLKIKNGDETIEVENIILRNDSLIASLPVFNTELLFRVESSDMLSGYYIDHNRDDYRISVNGEHALDFRFTNTKSFLKIERRYSVIFTESDSTTYPATLVLSNDSGRVEGTFMTERGDYRYLEGNLMNNGLYLSTFDGTHAFYFEADIAGDSLLNGVFLSGTHYKSNWTGYADANATLSDPESLTRIDDNKAFNFRLPNQDGDTMTYESMGLQGKIVIFDIMGTWCPNCMDAARSLASIIQDYDNVKVVPVLFEYRDDLTSARRAYEKFSSQIDLSGEFLFGGTAGKANARKQFPMLSDVTSFPTLIFLSPSGEVVRIYTGFYGPATGENYDYFLTSTRSLLDSLAKAS